MQSRCLWCPDAFRHRGEEPLATRIHSAYIELRTTDRASFIWTKDQMGKPYEFLSRTGDGVCVIDGEQRIVLWNDAATGLLGFVADEVLGRRCYEVLEGTDESGCAVCQRNCAISHAVRRGKSVPARNVRVRTRDARALLVSVSTIALPASWHELTVLAHLFRRVDARGETESIGTRLPERIVRTGTANSATGSAPTRPIERLTRREHDVLRLLTTGASTETICARLGIAISTTRAHVRSILAKLGVRDRLEAVTFGLRVGLVEIARDDDLPPRRRTGLGGRAVVFRTHGRPGVHMGVHSECRKPFLR